MIKVTKEEYKKATGEELIEVLPKDSDSLQVERFIDYGCKIIDRFLRINSPGLFRDGYKNLSDFQIGIIKEACIEQLMILRQTGRYHIDESGLPKRIPISDDVVDILRPIIYTGRGGSYGNDILI